MTLVAYSDSEASDSEHETSTSTPAPAPSSTTKPTPAVPTIVDKANPRKIRVALPDLKLDPSSTDNDDGPARKKPRVGGGGAFSGFNSFLPAPKQANAAAEEKKKAGFGAARKVFSLKTGAERGFDREADEEMRKDWAFERLGAGDDDETIPKAGSLRGEEAGDGSGGNKDVEKKKPEEVVLKGNPMMFKPLSVARTGQKKKKTIATIIPPPMAETKTAGETSVSTNPAPKAAAAPALPPPKPKVSLFSLSSEETASPGVSTSAHASAYEPLVYTTNESAPAAGPIPEAESAPVVPSQTAPSTQTLDHIADDLNLSRSQRRQLFGRNADSANSRILHFNTDAEYASNQEMAHKELAAAQHNPVRAIAPGKHTLQQLVNAASTQKEALEESFATGKRNKKEAGSRYGW
ncbi:mitotic checkpoint regulator, MAD2B-interacting-domain-containing protein [Aspergillus karnatakaensis]|uniref:PRCC domain-containing protein n=1 Tax=Aspergillus karnatakaensis TaxID=1810916 RepID=UPI003CCD2F68